MEVARLLLLLSVRSVLAHRVKSAFVGGVLFAGTFGVVLGSALLDSIEESMARSITGSMAGHLQVYSAEAVDPLALFGDFSMATSDIGEIAEIEDVVPAIEAVPNVASVVPMGITTATVFGRNEIDQVLSDLRDAVRSGDRPKRDRLAARARRIVDSLATEAHTRAAIDDPERAARDARLLERAGSDAFWEGLAADPLPHLDELDASIAPMASDGRVYYLRVIGADPQQFAESFDRFYIVDGEAIPPGKRGILFSKRTYEELIKHPVARALDILLDEHLDGGDLTGDLALSDQVKRLARQYRRVTLALDPADADALAVELRELLGSDGALDELVRTFLTVDNSTIEARHAWFAEHIAPRLALYEVPVGSTVTLRGFTRSGYIRSVNVPVYGTYELRGLEKAGLQSASNLADLITFRELYGKMSDLQRAELDSIRADVGVASLDRADAEAALFGGGAALETDEVQREGGIEVELAPTDQQDAWSRSYPVEELGRGLALNAAILLEDPSLLRETQAAVQQAIDDGGLGLQVVDYKVAAGMLGQFVTVMRIVLWTALFIIFMVALILINNAMVTATLDRTAEIGTMRAIGAQRSLVIALFATETALLGVIAGGAGAAVGAAVVAWLGQVGLPAGADILVLLFAGDRLYPSFGLDDLALGLGAVVGVSLISTAWPALLAARIPPVVAMQGTE